MKPLLALSCLPAAALLLALAACDRNRDHPSGAARSSARIESGAVSVPVSPATVALSGAVGDLPAATTPDANIVPSKPAAAAAAPQRSVRPPPAVGGSLVSSLPVTPQETPAMRAFREAQARRDRELLEGDMARAGSRAHDGAPVDRDGPREALPRDDGTGEDLAADDPPPDDAVAGDDAVAEDNATVGSDDDLPPDATDDDPPPEDDGDLHWDPATGTWR